ALAAHGWLEGERLQAPDERQGRKERLMATPIKPVGTYSGVSDDTVLAVKLAILSGAPREQILHGLATQLVAEFATIAAALTPGRADPAVSDLLQRVAATFPDVVAKRRGVLG